MTGGQDPPDGLSIHVNIPDPQWAGSAPDALIRRAVATAIRAEGVEEGEVSVTLLGDGEIRTLNRDYLGHDRPTDVLSFALHDAGEPVVGDLYIGAEVARRQAKERSLPVDEELVRLAIHGTLHVLGYDHPEGEGREESELFRKQEVLVRQVMA